MVCYSSPRKARFREARCSVMWCSMSFIRNSPSRGTHLSLEQTMKRINEWYMGWSDYYPMTQYPAQFVKIEAHTRRRIRARIVDQQKRRRHLYNKLTKRGVPGSLAKTVFLNHGRWMLSRTGAMHKAYPNRWFTEVMGQQIRSNAKLKYWFYS